MEKNIMKKPYNIGLDIGTTSVGWAVVDTNTFKVIKRTVKKIEKKGKVKGEQKVLWGVRLFDEAESAKSRREKRSTRRRYDRRRARIKLLQKQFEEEILKVDPNFFVKLKESFYNEKDDKNKTVKLTKEEKKQIKDYYKEYPTIYHLRERLIKNPEKEDVRLVYLALHHIIKYRGNFLYENDNFNVNDLNIREKLEEVFSSFINYVESFDADTLQSIDYFNLEKALLIKSKKDKKVELKKELEKFLSKKMTTSFVNALMGYKFSLNNMFDLELEKEEKTTFDGSVFEDNIDELVKVIPDKIEFLNALKELYDMIFLKTLFRDSNEVLISSLMVQKYNIHKENLKLIKELLKHNKDEYDKIFKTKDKYICLYDRYMKNPNTDFDNKKIKEALKESLSKTMGKINDTKLLEKYNELKEKLENENYIIFPKITETDNGKFPYQLNKEELIRIIENQGKYYPFLLEKVREKYKILKLLEFRIPYYVGPLHNYTSDYEIDNPNMWMIRKQDNVLITPYNFEEVVDINASAEKFITRMIKNCTYLLDEPSIPANSILYSKFKVLNELKQIKINDQKLTNEQQKAIYNNLFLKEPGIITNNKFVSYLISCNYFSPYLELNVKGYSAKDRFANNMQSYIDFFGDDGIFKGTNYKEADAEEIIRLITIFEDKKILKEKINANYKLDDQAINKILSKKYKGWSNLSKTLLTDIYYQDDITNEHKNIITLMTETEENFMQILNNRNYKFQDKIDKFNNKNIDSKLSYELIENLVTSPATKRGIYQALKIVDEIVNFMGYEPEHIVLEMARGEEEKKRKDSRKEKLEKIYKSIKKDVENYNELCKELASHEKIDNRKLYLYFLQLGKSLYSGKKLNIENLSEYEIDHIIPRTLIKDDSIDNLALVLREENQNKAASFVVPREYRNKSFVFWNQLHKLDLISTSKLNRLKRKEYKDSDIEGFINRQLVETRQISKHVANILKNLYPKSNIVYLHANLSSNYREKFKLYKFREINDYHHAHDAYLAAVLGEYKEEYLKIVDFAKLKEISEKNFKNKQYDYFRYGYVINSLENGLQHISEKTGEIFDTSEFNDVVEKTLYRNDILVTKKTELSTGEFYNQTKKTKADKNIDIKVKLKDNLPANLYGYYDGVNKAYTIVVKYKKKNKETNKMLGIPIHIFLQSKKNQNIINEYIRKALKLKDDTEFKIIKDKIPFNALLNWNGKLCYLVGSGAGLVEVCNAVQFHFERDKLIKWGNTLHRLLNNKKKVIDDINYGVQLGEIIDYIIEKIKKHYPIYEKNVIRLKEWYKYKNTEILSLEEKENIVKQTFRMLRANSENANLKFLGQTDRFGRLNELNISSAKIINQSITGIWESEDEF